MVALLSKAGVQLPVTPFKEVTGSNANTPPAQIGATELKVGTTVGVTVRVKVVVVAH